MRKRTTPNAQRPTLNEEGRGQRRRTAAWLQLFVFIRVDSWLDCAKQILWSSLVDAFAAGHDTC